MTSRKECLPLCFPEVTETSETLALIQLITFLILENKIGRPQFSFSQQPLCQNDAELGDNLIYPEITEGCILLSLGKGDTLSHSWHPMFGSPLGSLPSKSIQNLIAYHHLLCYHLGSSGYCLLSDHFIRFLISFFTPLHHHPQRILNTVDGVTC